MSITFNDEQFLKLSKGLDAMRMGLDLIATITAEQPTDSVIVKASPVQDDTSVNQASDNSVHHVVPSVGSRPIPWGQQCKELHPDFIEGLLWIESKIALTPEVLIPCMKFESNINPKARNPQSSASGLIQFMSGTAKNLGTTIENIRGMDAMGQLSYVYKYFANQREDWSGMTVADVYMAILWPMAIGKPDDYVLWSSSNGAYTVNRGLDWNKDGKITKAEATKRIYELEKQGYQDGNVLYLHIDA